MTLPVSTIPKMVDTDDLLDITLHKHQLQAYFSKKRITALISGIQGGKTRIGGLWINRYITMYDAPQQNFIIAAPTFKLMAKSTLPWMLHLLKGTGYFDKKYNRFHLNGGGVIWFASMVDNDSVEGATNVRAIWIDEGGKIRYNAWINLLARSSFRQCPIMITSTPYSLNWLYQDIYEPWRKGERSDIEIVQFRSCDNPYFPIEEYEHQKTVLDNRTFMRKYGGTFQKMAGLVYPDIDENNFCDPFNYDRSRYYVCAGIDPGWTNQFAIAVRAIALDGSYDFQIAEFYKSFVELDQRIDILKQFQKAFGIQEYFCDSEAPDQISFFQSAGLPVTAAIKGKGSVNAGIILHNELIRSNIYKMFRGRCNHTLNEYEMYHYPESEEDKEKNPTENPIDMNNHLMDCNRYVTFMTKHLRDTAKERKQYQKWNSPIEEIQNEKEEIEARDWYENEEMEII